MLIEQVRGRNILSLFGGLYRSKKFHMLQQQERKTQKKKKQINVQTNEIKLLRKIVVKTKLDRIRNQEIREYCGIQPINDGNLSMDSATK